MTITRMLMGVWQDLTCPHHWVRARRADGSYGYRCMDCCKDYPRTWNDLLRQSVPAGSAAPLPWTGEVPGFAGPADQALRDAA